MPVLINRKDVVNHIDDCTICNPPNSWPISEALIKIWTKDQLVSFVTNSHGDWDYHVDDDELTHDEHVGLMTT
jgi:hypothetical protein